MVRRDKIKQRIACIYDDLIDFAGKKSSAVEQGIPVVITGVPRSGTTAFGEMLNSDKVFLYHEPFLKNTILWNDRLAEKVRGPFDKNAIIKTYSDIQAKRDWMHYRKANRRYPYLTKGALHKVLPLKKRRIVIKDPSISFCLDDISPLLGKHYGIILMRNPLSIVTSLLKHNWDPIQRLKIIYSHSYFKKFDLHRGHVDAGKIETMQPIERMALQTGLLHSFIHEQASRHENYKIVYFENLISDVNTQLKQLSSELDFSPESISQKHLQRITTNASNEIKRHTYRRNSKEYLEPWKSALSTDDCAIINHYYTIFNPPYST